MDIIIKKNTPIPCSKTKIYYTRHYNQEVVNVDVLQGEAQLTKDCHLVANTKVNLIPDDSLDNKKISVTFSIDINGVLNVTAQSTSNEGNVVHLTISKEKLNLPSEEIARLTAIALKEKEEN